MLHILMVDDEPDLDVLIQQRFRRLVKDGQVKLSFARDGQKAMDLLEETKVTDPIGLVITDLNMPQMNGIELLLQAKKDFHNTKIFVISAYSDQESVNNAKNAGADGFLFKPLNFKDLEEIVHAEMQARQ